MNLPLLVLVSYYYSEHWALYSDLILTEHEFEEELNFEE